MPPPSTPVVEVRLGPLQVTLASWGVPVPFGCANANIAQVLSRPATSIVVFITLMVAAPLDCIRSPVLLLPRGLGVLMILRSGVSPVVAIEMSALSTLTPPLLAALTAFPPAGRFTMTPGSSVMLIGCAGPALTLMGLV